MSALTDYFTSLANKIRTKTGKSDMLTPDDMVDEVDAVYAAGAASVPTPTSQSKSVTPSTSSQTVTPDSGYDYLSQVSIGAIQTQTKSATPSTTAQTITPDSGKFLSSVSVGSIQTQEKTANAYQSYNSVLSVTPDSGKYLSKVNIPKAFNGELSSYTLPYINATPGTTRSSYSIPGAGIYLLLIPLVESYRTNNKLSVTAWTGAGGTYNPIILTWDSGNYVVGAVLRSNGVGTILISGTQPSNKASTAVLFKLADL